MARRIIRASRPTPIAHGFIPGFYGERCPVCGINWLAACLEYPVCVRCRDEYDIDEKMLKSLIACRLVITQDTIDWNQNPPLIDGMVNNTVRWQATFSSGIWQTVAMINIGCDEIDREQLEDLISKYLNAITPAWLEQAKEKKTSIRRTAFLLALSGTIITAGVLLKRKAIKEAKILREAKEAEQHPTQK